VEAAGGVNFPAPHPGASLTTDGVLTGIPSQARVGGFTFQVVMTDSQGNLVAYPVTMMVAANTGPTIISPANNTVFPLRRGVNSRIEQLQAVDGPVTWSLDTVNGDRLPMGLSLNPVTGVINGITMTVGLFTIVTIASNATGDSAPLTIFLDVT